MDYSKNNGIITLRNLEVEMGQLLVQMPLLASGYMKPALGNEGMSFLNNHDYILGGVDDNNVKGYICACGEIFLGYCLALDHYNKQFQTGMAGLDADSIEKNHNGSSITSNSGDNHCERDSNFDNGNVALASWFHAGVDALEASCDHDTSGNIEMAKDCDSSVPSVTSVQLAMNQEDAGKKQEQKGYDFGSLTPCTKQAIIRYLVYSKQLILDAPYRKQLAYYLGIHISTVRAYINQAGEASIISKRISEKLHEIIINSLVTWTNATGYVAKDVAIFCSMYLKHKQMVRTNQFTHAYEIEMNLGRRCVRRRLKYAEEECEKLKAVITPTIRQNAEHLYKKICKFISSSCEDDESETNKLMKAKLIMQGIFKTQPMNLSVEYRHKCAEFLQVPFHDVNEWWKQNKGVKLSRLSRLLTKDILQDSKQLHQNVIESLSNKEPGNHDKAPPKIIPSRLIINGIFKLYRPTVCLRYRKICAAKIKSTSKTIRRIFTEAQKRYESNLEDPYDAFITEDILSQSRALHEFVLEKLQKEEEEVTDEST